MPDRQLTRGGDAQTGLAVIRLYSEGCVPHGFFPAEAFSEALHEALELFTEGGLDDEDLNQIRSMFDEAVELRNAGERIYNNPRGAKLLRILWSNY